MPGVEDSASIAPNPCRWIPGPYVSDKSLGPWCAGPLSLKESAQFTFVKTRESSVSRGPFSKKGDFLNPPNVLGDFYAEEKEVPI